MSSTPSPPRRYRQVGQFDDAEDGEGHGRRNGGTVREDSTSARAPPIAADGGTGISTSSGSGNITKVGTAINTETHLSPRAQQEKSTGGQPAKAQAQAQQQQPLSLLAAPDHNRAGSMVEQRTASIAGGVRRECEQQTRNGTPSFTSDDAMMIHLQQPRLSSGPQHPSPSGASSNAGNQHERQSPSANRRWQEGGSNQAVGGFFPSPTNCRANGGPPSSINHKYLPSPPQSLSSSQLPYRNVSGGSAVSAAPTYGAHPPNHPMSPCRPYTMSPNHHNHNVAVVPQPPHRHPHHPPPRQVWSNGGQQQQPHHYPAARPYVTPSHQPHPHVPHSPGAPPYHRYPHGQQHGPQPPHYPSQVPLPRGGPPPAHYPQQQHPPPPHPHPHMHPQAHPQAHPQQGGGYHHGGGAAGGYPGSAAAPYYRPPSAGPPYPPPGYHHHPPPAVASAAPQRSPVGPVGPGMGRGRGMYPQNNPQFQQKQPPPPQQHPRHPPPHNPHNNYPPPRSPGTPRRQHGQPPQLPSMPHPHHLHQPSSSMSPRRSFEASMEAPNASSASDAPSRESSARAEEQGARITERLLPEAPSLVAAAAPSSSSPSPCSSAAKAKMEDDVCHIGGNDERREATTKEPSTREASTNADKKLESGSSDSTDGERKKDKNSTPLSALVTASLAPPPESPKPTPKEAIVAASRRQSPRRSPRSPARPNYYYGGRTPLSPARKKLQLPQTPTRRGGGGASSGGLELALSPASKFMRGAAAALLTAASQLSANDDGHEKKTKKQDGSGGDVIGLDAILAATKEDRIMDQGDVGGVLPSPVVSSSGKKGRARGRGGSSRSSSSSTKTKKRARTKAVQSSQSEEEEDENTPPWRCSSTTLALPEDNFWISELQCYLRGHFVEAFGATRADLAAPTHGRNRPTFVGQVGIRCAYCSSRSVPPGDRGAQAVSYPTLVGGIYNCVQQMLRLHVDCCSAMPSDVREKIAALKASGSARGGRKQYWIDSAERLGMADTARGIVFEKDPAECRRVAESPSSLSAFAAEVAASQGSEDAGGNRATPASDGSADLGSKADLKAVSASSSASTGAANTVDGNGDGSPALPGSAAASTDGASDVARTSSSIPPTGHGLVGSPEPLVLEKDRPLIARIYYLALQQMRSCSLIHADRVGCYKGRDVGFLGLACRHCVGQAGCGRYFPASEASLSQTTTSQTILNHVRNCRKCPEDVRDEIEAIMRGRPRKEEKPKHGGRKVFFHRLWCRIQKLGEPLEEDEMKEMMLRKPNRKQRQPRQQQQQTRSPAKRTTGGRLKAKKGSRPSRRLPKAKAITRIITPKEIHDGGATSSTESASESDSDSSQSTNTTSSNDSDDDRSSSESEASCSEDESVSTNGDEHKQDMGEDLERYDSSRLLVVEDGSDLSEGDLDEVTCEAVNHRAFRGSTTLSKTDDLHWLSELHCFVRSECVEVFAASEEDVTFSKNESVVARQVGIRCVYCAARPVQDRPKGHVYYPNSVDCIQQVVSDLMRRHFCLCPNMSREDHKNYKSLKGHNVNADANVQQYWIDSAKDLGLITSSHGGVRFRRDPNTPSQADELTHSSLCNGSDTLIHSRDRSLTTDYLYLLLCQVRQCRFEKRDVPQGRTSTKQRQKGYPGLECMHCSSKRGRRGRYFPLSAKILGDSTVPSLFNHLLACKSCPQDTKSSLSYLVHRNSYQKAELRSGWKKQFYQSIWGRLHPVHPCDEHSAGSIDEGPSENQPDDKMERNGDGSDTDDDPEKNCIHSSTKDHTDATTSAAIARWLSTDDSGSHAVRGRPKGLKRKVSPDKFSPGGERTANCSILNKKSKQPMVTPGSNSSPTLRKRRRTATSPA